MTPHTSRCADCETEGITTKRKTTGVRPPLCASHRRARNKARRTYSWAEHIKKTYDLTEEQYWAIYTAQGSRCYICARPRAKNAKKKLSVDHDHKTGFVRGLLCQRCNRDVLGYFRDDPDAFRRGLDYLNHPPAVDVIGWHLVPGEGTK